MLNIWLNDTVVGHSEFTKNDWFTVCCVKNDE